MFQHFWLEIAYYGPKFYVRVVNGDHMLKFNGLTPKGTSLHDSTSFEPLHVKICSGV